MDYKLEEIKTMGINFKKTCIAYELGLIDIKKSGHNKYSDYDYMEMEDFLPHLRQLMFKYRVCTEFSMDQDNKIGIMQLLDCDSSQKLVFTMPYEVPEIKATNLMQKIGGAATYLRRYLLINAFDIAENDMLDSQVNNKPVDKPVEKVDKSKQKPVERQPEYINQNQSKLLYTIVGKLGKDNEQKKACMTFVLKTLADKNEILYDLTQDISTSRILTKDFDKIKTQLEFVVNKKLEKAKEAETPNLPKWKHNIAFELSGIDRETPEGRTKYYELLRKYKRIDFEEFLSWIKYKYSDNYILLLDLV